MSTSDSDVCLYVLALFLPPVAVTLKAGCGADSLINSLLTLLGWLPGLMHAWWVISTYSSRQRAPIQQPLPYPNTQPAAYGYEYGSQPDGSSPLNAQNYGTIPQSEVQHAALPPSNTGNYEEKKEE